MDAGLRKKKMQLQHAYNDTFQQTKATSTASQSAHISIQDCDLGMSPVA